MSCVGCNHSVPMWRTLGPWHSSPQQVEADLGHLTTFLHADKWGALGGEPLLNPKLGDILDVVRATKICDILEVWTNGLLVMAQPPSFWRKFDHLVHSIYPGKFTEAQLADIRQKCADEGVTYVPKDERHHPNFRTMLEPEPTDPISTRIKFKGCFFRSFSRNATRGFFFTCCCGPHIPVAIQHRTFGDDGLRIAGSTEADVRSYLDCLEPLGACYVCAGRDTARPITWREERDPEAWLKASAGR